MKIDGEREAKFACAKHHSYACYECHREAEAQVADLQKKLEEAKAESSSRLRALLGKAEEYRNEWFRAEKAEALAENYRWAMMTAKDAKEKAEAQVQAQAETIKGLESNLKRVERDYYSDKTLLQALADALAKAREALEIAKTECDRNWGTYYEHGANGGNKARRHNSHAAYAQCFMALSVISHGPSLEQARARVVALESLYKTAKVIRDKHDEIHRMTFGANCNCGTCTEVGKVEALRGEGGR